IGARAKIAVPPASADHWIYRPGRGAGLAGKGSRRGAAAGGDGRMGAGARLRIPGREPRLGRRGTGGGVEGAGSPTHRGHRRMNKYVTELIGTFFLVFTIGCTVLLGGT